MWCYCRSVNRDEDRTGLDAAGVGAGSTSVVDFLTKAPAFSPGGRIGFQPRRERAPGGGRLWVREFPRYAAQALLRIGSFQVYRGRAVADINGQPLSIPPNRLGVLAGRSWSPRSARLLFSKPERASISCDMRWSRRFPVGRCVRGAATALGESRPGSRISSAHEPAWRRANAGHVSLGQLKVMSAIESGRTASLGGHVALCEKCRHTLIPYNSCRNRHCPKCQGLAAKEWLAEREAELLPVPYYHVVFTLPAAIAEIAYHNKAVIYGILFKAAAETLTTSAADPKHLGARIGFTAVLHSWGSAMTHHRTSTSLCRAAASRATDNDGSHAGPAFSSPSACSRGCFGACSWNSSPPFMPPGRLQFFADHAGLNERGAFTAKSRTAAQDRMGRLQQAPV